MAHPHEDLIRRAFDAFGKGDMETLGDVFADDAVFHVPGRSKISGDYKGKGEIFGFFGKLQELSGGTFKTEVHDVVANDEHVVALAPGTGEREGKRLSDNGVLVHHIKDGKVAEVWLHAGDQYAGDEFWS